VRRARFLVVGLVLAAYPSYAATPSDRDLADLTLEELANVEITSVSKKPERLLDASASVFVISSEDIRRSGATSLPEALRLAPNLQVAQVDARQYAISARGFNNTADNKLLVLIDGRSVYTPLFSGVFWDVQDVMLEDVERIEVISGPGGTLWGTNAVNGVINVITRQAKDTQGGLMSVGGGNTEAGAAVRYGGAFGENGHYRIYGKFFDRQDTSTANGNSRNDAWNKGQIGFRSDWGSAAQQFTLQGDTYSGDFDQTAPGTGSISGTNLLGRWGHQLDGGSSLRLQAYYDHTERTIPGTFGEKRDIYDLEFEHSLQAATAHAVVWGASYRYGVDRVSNTAVLAFLPADVNQQWASLFGQDEITLRPDLRLTLGARLERNDYTGNEFLPNARLAWNLSSNRLLWTAASRAVRAPSRIDRDFFVPGQAPFLFAGGSTFHSEVAKVFEVGYRAQPTAAVSYSVTVFHSIYDALRSIEPTPSGSLMIDNKMEGTTNGIEMWGSYQALQNWRLSGGFTALRERLQLKPDSADPLGVSAEGNDPAHSWILRSTVDLSGAREFDVTVRRVSALPNPAVPAYVAVDVRLGWKPRNDLELSLTGRNLFDDGHPEFGNPVTRSEIGRSAYIKLLWHF
jgi:iron complex outermembrane receptor protein